MATFTKSSNSSRNVLKHQKKTPHFNCQAFSIAFIDKVLLGDISLAIHT